MTIRERDKEIIFSMLQQMERRPDQQYTIPDLAAKAGSSPSKFTAMFRRVTGYSVQEAITAIRMRVASELLSTSLPISRIAGKVGYENDSSFSRAFKKAVGMTPREFRRKNK